MLLHKLLMALLLGAAWSVQLSAATINVPVDEPTIQAGINAAVSGVDEVVVAPGTYTEAINFNGKAITVRSASGDPDDTIIAGTGNLRVVQCVTNETCATVLSGFTVTGGNTTGSGAGMLNNNSSPTVTNCHFSGNTASDKGGGMGNFNDSRPTVTHCRFIGNTATTSSGGGMLNHNSSPTVMNCLFSDNTASLGGGMSNNESSSPTVLNCSFIANTASNQGGGMSNLVNCSPLVANCTFSGNTANLGGGMSNSEQSHPLVANCSFSNNAADFGGGVNNLINCTPMLANCVLWGDLPDEIFNLSSSLPTVRFSDVQGGLPANTVDGGANIDVDPLFVDADGPDDSAGTEDDNLRLQASSPCIDGADSTLLAEQNIYTDFDGNLRFVNFTHKADTGAGPYPFLDRGPYETAFDCAIPADINCDGIVNLTDQALLALHWLEQTG